MKLKEPLPLTPPPHPIKKILTIGWIHGLENVQTLVTLYFDILNKILPLLTINVGSGTM
jgi:hypothetical protein